MTTQTVLSAYFGYRDAVQAIDWLGKALGFEPTMQFPDEHGGIMHAELRLGDAAIVVFSDRDGYERAPRRGDTAGHGLYLSVDSEETVDRIYQQAVAEGATTIWAAGRSEWNYRFRVADPEGFEWTVGTYRFGEPQPEWS
ncbi:glyoxalase [Actinosynnema sp. ALI-1.44]|uniref:VOC family protein n=1 Tax=Actinosynnema sp. ALI-1.44 TaxID=1933779 RepID=UPI00097C0350|nr:VOC family protein [Actinosynnema sp. ALI-1.44]ONI79844.1 glyoxalase [Actinosynnema sp. ALI-1.44]